MSERQDSDLDSVAARLAALYEQPFGGKARGRFRISMKHLRALTGRRRLYAEDLAALGRALYESGYVLIDLENFFVVLSQKTFASYRRVNEISLEARGNGPDARPDRPARRDRDGGRDLV